MLVFPVTHQGYILVLPVAIAAWMFGKRGLLITFSVGLFPLLVYHTVRLGGVLWPPPFTERRPESPVLFKAGMNGRSLFGAWDEGYRLCHPTPGKHR